MSRDRILSALRRNRPPASAALDLAEIAQTFPDPVAKFADLQRANGSTVHEVADRSAAIAEFANDGVLLDGEIGVAENGAIWVSFEADADRAAPFLVSNMLQAYRQMESLPEYGVFIAGPSKTADIAQCLVVGAHGPISMQVFILANPASPFE
jgi:L-lactate utilization protein LutC